MLGLLLLGCVTVDGENYLEEYIPAACSCWEEASYQYGVLWGVEGFESEAACQNLLHQSTAGLTGEECFTDEDAAAHCWEELDQLVNDCTYAFDPECNAALALSLDNCEEE